MTEYQPNSDAYKPNSHAYKNQEVEKKKISPVVTGKTKTKKNEVRKFTNAFISEDMSNVRTYLFGDVLIPSLKKLLSEIVATGVNMLLFGEARDRKSNSRSYVSYRSYSDDRDSRYRSSSLRTGGGFNYDDIVFDSRGDADAVLMEMDNVIDQYGIVTVSDLFGMAQMSAPYTSNKYGWTNIRTAEPVRLRDGGYILKLPRAVPID